MNKLIFTFLLFPYLLSAQISSHIYYQSDSTISCEIIQLDSVKDAHRQIIYYHENGTKSSEFLDRYGVVYDTLNRWDELGNLSYHEFHSDTGYTGVNYFDNGDISSIGYWKRVKNTSYEITIIDSSTFDVYESVNCNENCYERSGVWKYYYPNGNIESKGRYLPMEFTIEDPTVIDSNGVTNVIPKTSFEMIPDIIYIVSSTFLLDGKWTYYHENGEIKEEINYCKGFPVKLKIEGK